MTLTDDVLEEDPAAALTEEAEDQATRQYVTFFLRGECFAFPIDMVQEIIRVPDTVAVPMTPPALIGLANLRGVVLPVVDLRGALGLPVQAPEEASRVIVVNAGQSVGLLVDRVARVTNVSEAQIEPARQVDRAVQVDMLTGVVKSHDDTELIQILDPALVIAQQFPEAEARGDPARVAALAAVQPPPVNEAEDDTVQLVSLMIAQEEYAFPIDSVDEIVRVPEKISVVPRNAPHVLGLITLRDRLLPLVSLRGIFGLAAGSRSDSNRVVVLRLGQSAEEDLRVGVVVDQVREVLRVPASARDPLPGVLRGAERQEIEAVCQLDGGQRLVSVLSGSALFDLPTLRDVAALAQGTREAGSDPGEEETVMNTGETEETQLVVYQLDTQEFGVDIHSVQEIIRVPETLARVPKAPETVEGIINLRGMVLPVVEMRRRFGIAPTERGDRQRILVLNVDGIRTGYIVDSVAEVLRVPASAMEPSPRLSKEADRLVGRVASLQNGARMVLVLDARALMADDAELEALRAEATLP
ncbi:chemotaxis protein CheW [Pseudooceanicola sp. CBS1P-1]|uniref:Chemotaxis protein CheW n=1 Tax=Pseudooceanicola albus TaxID=2692189 RepID=A0A6L7G833_9RHOB|nr:MULTISPECIES: chemotaxis protein CheW [Pseudooceanicola]MBT9382845.1 chemotaxis protein CheW [Pseudooceanicola endophyticus]MXN20231.1 chemotaxis protein CheW [Pseudooceanicola albus]